MGRECTWEPACVGDAGYAGSRAPGFWDVHLSDVLCGLAQWACAFIFSLVSS